MLSILVRLDILMRMEKNRVSLNFHVSHISILDTPSRRHALQTHFPLPRVFRRLEPFHETA